MNDTSYSMPLRTWAEASSRVFTTFLETNRAANRAAFAAFQPRSSNGEKSGVESNGRRRLDPGGDLEGWNTERLIEGELSVGDSVRFSKAITQEDIERFASASGDTNPLHLDDELAEESRFNGRIAHGVLVAGLISAALARLPGSVVYLSQDLEFRAPVRIGDTVTASAEIVEELGSGQYRIRTTVTEDDTIVIDGEAVVLIDSPPAEN
jgi:acyl dehydratase